MKQIFIFLMISVNALAQTVDSYVYDIYDNPLGNVEIRNKKSGKIIFSDSIGFFSIEGGDRDMIIFTHAGYVTTELTIKNIKNSNKRIYLFKELSIELAEVIVTPNNNMYELHEKAVYNLKSRLIKNRAISYECTLFEKEINFGDEKGLNMLFTALLNKINPKQRKINYEYLLSKLEVTHGTTSVILKDNKLYHSDLFPNSIDAKMPKSPQNSMQISDSIIVIKNVFNDRVRIYTIDKTDTTLIKIETEARSDLKYRPYRTFKGKRVYSSYSIEFRKEAEEYYMYELVWNTDYSFLLGRPEREERIVSVHKISILPYTIHDASLKVNLDDSRKLYNMGDYPAISH